MVGFIGVHSAFSELLITHIMLQRKLLLLPVLVGVEKSVRTFVKLFRVFSYSKYVMYILSLASKTTYVACDCLHSGIVKFALANLALLLLCLIMLVLCHI